MAGRDPQEGWALFYIWRLQGLRELVASKGYTLAVHGSFTYDLDCIAVPWTEEAVDVMELVEAVAQFVGADVKSILKQDTGNKPHGRKVWTISMGGGPHLDFSVMPRIVA